MSIEQDVQRLNRRVHALVWLCLVSVTLAMVAVAINFIPRPGKLPASGSVEADRFVVRNSDGSMAAEFGIMDSEPDAGLPAMRIYDRGVLRLQTCVMPDGRAKVAVSDSKGVERASLFVKSTPGPQGVDSAEISVANDAGHDVVKMDADRFGNGGVSLLDRSDQTRIQLDVPSQDKPPQVQPTLRFFNGKGDEILTLPVAQ